MSENKSSFPKFFIYMFLALIIVIIICAFFSVTAVGNTYFVMLLVGVVFMLLDRHYGFFITNYKPIFFMFDLAGLVAVLSIICYEYSRHSVTLTVFLFLILALRVALLIVDIFLVKDKFITKRECLAIDFIQICSMICTLTYFYKVSSFWYSVISFIFAIINISIKIYVAVKLKHRVTPEPVNNKVDETLNKISIGESEIQGDE